MVPAGPQPATDTSQALVISLIDDDEEEEDLHKSSQGEGDAPSPAGSRGVLPSLSFKFSENVSYKVARGHVEGFTGDVAAILMDEIRAWRKSAQANFTRTTYFKSSAAFLGGLTRGVPVLTTRGDMLDQCHEAEHWKGRAEQLEGEVTRLKGEVARLKREAERLGGGITRCGNGNEISMPHTYRSDGMELEGIEQGMSTLRVRTTIICDLA